MKHGVRFDIDRTPPSNVQRRKSFLMRRTREETLMYPLLEPIGSRDVRNGESQLRLCGMEALSA